MSLRAINLSALVALLLSGCGSIIAWKEGVGRTDRGIPMPFGGMAVDIIGVGYRQVYMLLDMPFSLVADVLTLPITVPAALGLFHDAESATRWAHTRSAPERSAPAPTPLDVGAPLTTPLSLPSTSFHAELRAGRRYEVSVRTLPRVVRIVRAMGHGGRREVLIPERDADGNETYRIALITTSAGPLEVVVEGLERGPPDRSFEILVREVQSRSVP